MPAPSETRRPTLWRRGVIGIVIVAAWLTGCPGRSGGPDAAPAATPVVTAVAERRQVPLVLEAPGSLSSINSVAVRARVDGEIVAVGFTEGAEVQAGQVLFRLDPRPLAAALEEARATQARDEAVLARAHAQLKRYQDLAGQGYVSADDYAQVTANQRVAEAAVASDRAAVDAAKLNLDYCTIRAPISGRSGLVALRKGALVKAADNVTLTTITQMDPLFVDFSVPQRYLEALARNRAAVRLSLRTTADAAARAASLEFIDNAVDAATGTIRLRARTDNADRALWPGEFTRVRLELGGGPQVLAVPGIALGNSPDGAYVYVIGPDGHAHQRPVTVDRIEGDTAILAGGIAAGDQVVIDGQSRLRDGVAVRVVPAAEANP